MARLLMNSEDKFNSNPMRELEWLAHFFSNHGREDIAREISDKLTGMKNRGRESNNETDSSESVKHH